MDNPSIRVIYGSGGQHQMLPENAGIRINHCHPKHSVLLDGRERPPVWKCTKCDRRLE